jgi:beta-xylosidase
MFAGVFVSLLTVVSYAQQTAPAKIALKDIRLRDVCVLPQNGTYYMVGPGRGAAVVQYTSKDLLTWEGPKEIYRAPAKLWGDTVINAVWAPELHAYKGKYYLFLTFSTNHLMAEQWLNWRPRVVRASQILVSDSPTGPFKEFAHHGTTPPGLITLDGTLWEEDGKPYMIYSHEWIQISNGAMECLPLKADLSEAAGPPTLLFRANKAPWSVASEAEGCYVTDGPYLYTSKSGKLFMIWSSFGKGGYTVGLAVSASGKVAGPWTQQATPLFENDGGHGMLFKTFDGKLLMALHTPNDRNAQPHFYQMEDTGETLRIVGEIRN